MTWIKSPVTLRNDPQVAFLARELGVSPAQAIGHLHALLWWCVETTEDGHLETRDPRVLASAGLWEGDPEIFVRALVQTGWIAPTEKGFQICRWEDYAGPVLKNRQRQARYRERKKGLVGSGERYGSLTKLPGDANTHPVPTPAPNVTANTTGNVTANVTSNVTANITGNVTVPSPNGAAGTPVTPPNATTDVTANVTANVTAPSPLVAVPAVPRQATGQTTLARDHVPHGSHDPVPSSGSGETPDPMELHGTPHATPTSDHACVCEKSFSPVTQEETHEAPNGSHGHHDPFPLKDQKTRVEEYAPTPRLWRGATPTASRTGVIPAWESTCVGETHAASPHVTSGTPSGSEDVQDRGGHELFRVGDPEGSGGGVEKADPHGDRARVKADGGQIAGEQGNGRCPEPDDDADLEALFDPNGPPVAEVVARIMARWGRSAAGGDRAAPAGGREETVPVRPSVGAAASPVDVPETSPPEKSSPAGGAGQEAAGTTTPPARSGAGEEAASAVARAVPAVGGEKTPAACTARPAPAADSSVGSAGWPVADPVGSDPARWLRPIAGGADGLSATADGPGAAAMSATTEDAGSRVPATAGETPGEGGPADRSTAPLPAGEIGDASPAAGSVRPSEAPHVPTVGGTVHRTVLGETGSPAASGLVFTVWELFGLRVTPAAGPPGEEQPAARTSAPAPQKAPSARSRATGKTTGRTGHRPVLGKTARPSKTPDVPTVAGEKAGAMVRRRAEEDRGAAATPEAPAAQALFAALQAALGHGPATRSERGAWNRAVKDLREAEPPVTPEEIPRLVAAFRRVWPGLTVTPMALAKHLGLLRRAPARGDPAGGRVSGPVRSVVDPATGLRPEVAQALRIRELFRARERQGGGA